MTEFNSLAEYQNAGVAQLVELLISNQNVEGSSPFARSKLRLAEPCGCNSVEECFLAKENVVGSIPTTRSK